METFVELDVSLMETSVCILNQKGALVFEGKVASEPTAIRPSDTQARTQRRARRPRERTDIGLADPRMVGRGAFRSSVSTLGMRKRSCRYDPTNRTAAMPADWPRWCVSAGSKRCRSIA
jgi:hypothetical protein